MREERAHHVLSCMIISTIFLLSEGKLSNLRFLLACLLGIYVCHYIYNQGFIEEGDDGILPPMDFELVHVQPTWIATLQTFSKFMHPLTD